MKVWTRRIVGALAVAYPVGLLAVILLLRARGETWWVTGVGLFLPAIGFALPMVVLLPALLLLKWRRLLWTQVVAALLVLFPLMGFVVPVPWHPGSGPSFRLLSYNVDSSFFGPEEVMRRIEAEAPDVVLIQESPDWTGLAERLHKRYPHVEVSTQFALATRFPIVSQTDPSRLKYGDRERSPRFMRYVVTTPLGEIVIYNVHPLSPRQSFYFLRGAGLRHELASGHLFTGGGGREVEENAGLRMLQIQTFAAMARAERGPVIVAGDTNQPTLAPLLSRELPGFSDGFRSGSWGLGYTFPAKRPWMRIDRVMTRGPIAVNHLTVGCAGASDHLCVVADIRRAD